MSSDSSKNEQIRQKCLKCLKNLNANFYTSGIVCRTMDKRNAGLKYRERDEEEKPLGGGTPSGMGRDTIPDN